MYLMNSLLSKIRDEVNTNATLAYITHCEIIQALTLPAIFAMLHSTPVCLVYPVSSQFVPVSMADACEDHVYQINIAVIIDDYGEDGIAIIGEYSTLKGITEIEADMRSVLNRNTLSISGLDAAYFQGASYSGIALEERALAQLNMRMRYEYTDIE